MWPFIVFAAPPLGPHGRPHLFPPSTNLCYGKGTGPFLTYPTNSDSILLAADFENRKCIEINCDNLKIGPFPATDFYGYGLLYLLDTPGHWPGHLCALARTTPDTFVYLGGWYLSFCRSIQTKRRDTASGYYTSGSTSMRIKISYSLPLRVLQRPPSPTI